MNITDINWVSIGNPEKEFKADVKIRYLHTPTPATVIPRKDNTAEITFETPQRAITPGQSAVFYQNDMVLGGGFIGS